MTRTPQSLREIELLRELTPEERQARVHREEDRARRVRARTFRTGDQVSVHATTSGRPIPGVVAQTRAYNDAFDGALLIRFGLCDCRHRSAQWVSANYVFHKGEGIE